MIGAELAQRRISGQCSAYERRGLSRQQNLSAMADRQQSRDLVDRRTEVVAFALVGSAGVDCRAHAQSVDCREILHGKLPLRREHCRNGLVGPRERAAEGITDRLEDVAAVFPNCRAQDRVVAAHSFLHGDAIMLPPRRAAFDVGEGKRHPGHLLGDSASRPRLTFSNGAVGTLLNPRVVVRIPLGLPKSSLFYKSLHDTFGLRATNVQQRNRFRYPTSLPKAPAASASRSEYTCKCTVFSVSALRNSPPGA